MTDKNAKIVSFLLVATRPESASLLLIFNLPFCLLVFGFCPLTFPPAHPEPVEGFRLNSLSLGRQGGQASSEDLLPLG
jgi:hypothetical protein